MKSHHALIGAFMRAGCIPRIADPTSKVSPPGASGMRLGGYCVQCFVSLSAPFIFLGSRERYVENVHAGLANCFLHTLCSEFSHISQL